MGATSSGGRSGSKANDIFDSFDLKPPPGRDRNRPWFLPGDLLACTSSREETFFALVVAVHGGNYDGYYDMVWFGPQPYLNGKRREMACVNMHTFWKLAQAVKSEKSSGSKLQILVK